MTPSSRWQAVSRLKQSIKNCYKRSQIGGAQPYINSSDQEVQTIVRHDPLMCDSCLPAIAQFVVDMLVVASLEKVSGNGDDGNGG